MISKLKNNKSGNLLGEETLKVLIAVICIGFLVYLLMAVYFSMNKSEKIKQAEGILNGKEGIITGINAGQTSYNFPPLTLVGWYLFGFTEKKPNSCLAKNCLCLCEKVGGAATFFDKDAQIKKCDKEGICSVVSNLNQEYFEIKIEKSTSISITQINGEVEITKN